MTSVLRQDIEAIFEGSLAAVHAGNAVRSHLRLDADGRLVVQEQHIEIGPDGVYAIAIGKASVAMIDAAAGLAGERFAAGLAVTKSESDSRDDRIRVLRGSHPVPDERSLAAGDAMLRFAEAIPRGAVAVCLISGGGSSLVESLSDGVSLARLRDLTNSLLRGGASIHELNVVRSRLSRIKAGGLLRVLTHARVINLVVSDVIGDDLQTIASGPTIPPTDGDADGVLQRFGLQGSLPPVTDRGTMSIPRTTVVVANVSLAIDHAAKIAAERGYAPVVLTRSLTGEAREVARVIAAVLSDGVAGTTSFGRRTCLLAGGETTVTVRGDGAGGRNTEAALAAAIRLSGVADVAVGFLATDGDDGETGVAGGIVDGDTVSANMKRRASAALDENDSYTLLHDCGATLTTGPTATNVNDLVIALVG